MPRGKRKGLNKLGVFKQYFQDHPEWLNAPTNEAVLSQFAADHPTVTIDHKVKQAMFNAKNFLKSGGKKGTPGRKKKVAAIRAAAAVPARRNSALQLLEAHVDDCLAMARQLGAEEFGDVIGHLHRARNILVYKIES